MAFDIICYSVYFLLNAVEIVMERADIRSLLLLFLKNACHSSRKSRQYFPVSGKNFFLLVELLTNSKLWVWTCQCQNARVRLRVDQLREDP